MIFLSLPAGNNFINPDCFAAPMSSDYPGLTADSIIKLEMLIGMWEIEPADRKNIPEPCPVFETEESYEEETTKDTEFAEYGGSNSLTNQLRKISKENPFASAEYIAEDYGIPVIFAHKLMHLIRDVDMFRLKDKH
ncbi:hypothetical protein KY317_02585, partial [Candidatus Woesearchaeota archaeon]|nr:hypothetical protein [Candidatus Woesearchaeota archaeon]